MKLLAFNGSPRKKWNTAQLLDHALKGAESEGAKTRLYHLYNLDFKGCISCFACKRASGKSDGHCAVKDDLKPIFEKIENADAILIGSPIYLGMTTGVTRCFLGRLIYQYLVYDMDRSSLFKKKIKTTFIYTAGATDDMIQEMGFNRNVKGTEMKWRRSSDRANPSLSLTRSSSMIISKKERYRKQFPLDCEKAYDLGARLVRQEK
jgi:multimeric flavodoxin WrbA